MSENAVPSPNIPVIKEEIKYEKVEYDEAGVKIEKLDSPEIKPEAGPSCAVKMAQGFLWNLWETFFLRRVLYRTHTRPPLSNN